MSNPVEPFQRVDVTAAKELIDGGTIHLIDVREQNEWDEGYIDGAVLISVNDIVA